ncbi:MAG: Cache domain protein [Methylococcales bacterium]|nr:Cache domain protein [Methylococcales bacterium]
MSHINVLEKYDEHHDAIHHLLSSILGCFHHERVFNQSQKDLSRFLNSLSRYYPFISILYLLDENGKQICKNIPGKKFRAIFRKGEGLDRSKRPYFLSAIKSDCPVITGPYLSSAGRRLCLSASTKIYDEHGDTSGYLVLDIDLDGTLNFFTGENRRIYFEPYFKVVYTLIVIGLFIFSFVLLYSSCVQVINFFTAMVKKSDDIEIPFQIVVYLTLALAIFDLGKTILEEEVLLYKDLSEHNSTRRTITRFIAAIIIAVSFEALMLVFRAALDHEKYDITNAVWVILAVSVLLTSLAIYGYLGSKSETLLQSSKLNIKEKQ